MDKIAHIAYSITRSDLKDLIAALIYKQQEQGAEAEIIHVVRETDIAHVLKIRGINVYTYTKAEGPDIRLMFKLGKFIRSHGFNIVHAHSPEIAVHAAIAAKIGRAKSIFSCHWLTAKPLSRYVRALNNHIVTTSEFVQRKLFKEQYLQDRKMKIIYDGIDEQMYMQNFGINAENVNREKLGLQADSFILGNTGALVKEEDQASLLKAFRKLRAKGMNAELIFTGEGPLRKDLEKKAQLYKVADRVHFLAGRLSRVEFLQLFDVLVHCAHKEAYPFTLLEAMASGTPVIATKIGANAEVILERQTGYLVPCGFPERIDSAIMRLNAIKTLPKEMGVQSRLHVQKDFSISSMAARYLELYHS
ncbi:MAG: glycosyltransferase [Candidatus Omnitrophica bacterium]|nr:glycosyltransferase [Candidatus Omnitrophota bacterium]